MTKLLALRQAAINKVLSMLPHYVKAVEKVLDTEFDSIIEEVIQKSSSSLLYPENPEKEIENYELVDKTGLLEPLSLFFKYT